MQQSLQANQIQPQNFSQPNQVILSPMQRVFQILNNQTTLPIDEFKQLIEQTNVNKQFLLITLNHKGKYFQTMKKLIMMITGLLTLQFYQLLFLFTTDEQINTGINQSHSKFIFQSHSHQQKQSMNNSFIQALPIQQQQINLIRISYVIVCWLSLILIQKLTNYFSNKKLMLFFLILISASYFIQGTQCNFITNYGSLSSQQTNTNDDKKIYLEKIIFFSCLISQAISSTCLLYLTTEQTKFILKKSQRNSFNNELLLIIVEFIVVSSTFHMIIKEHYIFNLIMMWIPFTLVTLFAFFSVEDTPISILRKLRNLIKKFDLQQLDMKKNNALKENQDNLMTDLYQNLVIIFQQHYPNKNYFTEEEVIIIIDGYYNKKCEKKKGNWKINFTLIVLVMLYFGHIFNLNLLVGSLQWTVETLALILSVFEIIGYFLSNYFIATIYNDTLLKKILVSFASMTILSSLQYFTQSNNHFQMQIIFVSILVIRILFYLALKAFLIQFQNYQLNFNFVVLGLLLSNSMFFQIQQIQLVLGILLILASHSISRL